MIQTIGTGLQFAILDHVYGFDADFRRNLGMGVLFDLSTFKPLSAHAMQMFSMHKLVFDEQEARMKKK